MAFRDRYRPLPHTEVDAFLTRAGLGAGETLVDLGSGDARLLIAAAQRGATAIGYELDAELVRKSRALVASLGLAAQVTIHEADYEHADLRDVDVVCANVTTGVQPAVVAQFRRTASRPQARLVVWTGAGAEVVR